MAGGGVKSVKPQKITIKYEAQTNNIQFLAEETGKVDEVALEWVVVDAEATLPFSFADKSVVFLWVVKVSTFPGKEHVLFGI